MKYWIVSLGVVWVTLPGCRARQQARTQYRMSGISESVRKDSMSGRQWAGRLKNRQAEVRQVEFTPPDSAGRQSVRTIRFVTIKEASEEESLTHTTIETSGEVISAREEAIDNREGFSSKGKRKWLPWIVPLLFLCGGIYIRLRMFFR